MEVSDYAQKVGYNWSYNICEKNDKKTASYFSAKSLLFVVHNFFTSMNLNIFVSNEDIWEYAAVSNSYCELACLFNKILFFNKWDRNVGRQICYHFYYRFAELLPKMWQLSYLDTVAIVIGSFVNRFGRLSTEILRNFRLMLSIFYIGVLGFVKIFTDLAIEWFYNWCAQICLKYWICLAVLYLWKVLWQMFPSVLQSPS